jgi:thymidylate synthase ThyX
MTIEAKVIAHSVNEYGNEIVSMQLRYPRFIHAEFMTHRVFSRNASSSRAIPVKKLIADIIRDPAMPVHWGANQPGMQARAELEGTDKKKAVGIWMAAMHSTVKHVEDMLSLGLHKQVANRMLEPWAHISVIVTSTSWKNFFALRCHPDAQPEIQELAQAIEFAILNSLPKLLKFDEWHLPYVVEEDKELVIKYYQDEKGKPPSPMLLTHFMRCISTARCARVSYLTHDGEKSPVEKDIALHDALVKAVPLHASPAEHQAAPDVKENGFWQNHIFHGNLTGWIQYRKMLPNEFVKG